MDGSQTGGLDNGAAAAWLQCVLERFDDVALVDIAFDLVAEAEGRGNVSRCQEAIAAAELVAAAGRKPRPGLDAETLAWVERNWTLLWQERRRIALATVTVVLKSSALADRWKERADFVAWRSDVENLLERLS